jgi:hypothetical protein
MHNRHLAGCGIMLAVAFGFLVLSGGSSAGLGLVLVALICPLAMILGVKLLLGERESHDQHRTDPTPAARRDHSPR